MNEIPHRKVKSSRPYGPDEAIQELLKFDGELGEIYAAFEQEHNSSDAIHRMERVFTRLFHYLEDVFGAHEANRVYASMEGRIFTDERTAFVYPYFDVKGLIRGLVKEIEDHGLEHLRRTSAPQRAVASSSSALDTTLWLCSRFHRFARELGKRRANKTAYLFEDEYDVQDALRGILRLHFDDVRPEEWTPSYAGGSSRVDFLLKPEQIVVEAKMTRDSLRDAKLGAELLVDVQRYRQHPDCKTLVCFVYNPEAFLANPDGLVADLSGEHEGVAVHVVITPAL